MSGGIAAGTLATIAGIGAAGSIGGAIIGSNAAGKAADVQSQAAQSAAQLQYQASQNALDFQKQQYNTSQQQMTPWLTAGQSGLNALQYGLGIGGTANGSGVGQGSLTQAYPGGPFTAPTVAQAEQMPGYQFQLQQGNQALQNSAAARGNLLTGGTAEALDNYSQGLAQSNYSNLYNQALQTYGTNYNSFQNTQANQYNRLAALAGAGQTTANNLATLGQNTANAESSNVLQTAGAMGQDYTNAGAANASGILGSASAWGNGISGATSAMYGGLQNLYTLQQFGQQSNPYQTLYNAQQSGIGGIQPTSSNLYGLIHG